MKSIDVICELNGILYDKDANIATTFLLSDNGWQQVITFGDEVMWNSDEDGRKTDEVTGDYEPLLPFVKQQFNNYGIYLQKLKFDE